MPRTRLRRLRELRVDDRAALDALLDTALVGHVGLVVDGEPVVIPTAVARHGDEKEAALAVVVDKLVPGRSAEVRPSTPAELRRTMVLAMPIARWSLKVSSGWSQDGPDDVAGPAWAGVVPLRQRAGAPEPAPDLAPGIPVPPSVRRLARRRALSAPGG